VSAPIELAMEPVSGVPVSGIMVECPMMNSWNVSASSALAERAKAPSTAVASCSNVAEREAISTRPGRGHMAVCGSREDRDAGARQASFPADSRGCIARGPMIAEVTRVSRRFRDALAEHAAGRVLGS